MFFIISTGRSGTKTVAQTLSQLKGIICVHEPNPVLAIEASNYRYGKITNEVLKNILIETRQPMSNGEIYCESNQALALIIPILKDTFPRARYVWLIRNGLDVVASAMQKQWYTGHSENYGRIENIPLKQQEWIKARLNGDECGEFSSKEWNSFSRFEKICWYWEYVNRIIEEDLKKLVGEDYFIIRLETIESQLPALIEWMDLDCENLPLIRITNPAKRLPYHWKKWSKTEKNIFELRSGQMMTKLYPGWKRPNGEWKGVEYEIEPARSMITFFIEGLRRNIRNITPKNNSK